MVLRYVISALIGKDRVFWGGRNDERESLWFTNFEDAYKVPGLHYMNNQVWRVLPDRVNHLDGQRCMIVPEDLRVEQRWIDD